MRRHGQRDREKQVILRLRAAEMVLNVLRVEKEQSQKITEE